ncbi:MAG: NfeD family protein, partial [Parvularculaceae bacterium]
MDFLPSFFATRTGIAALTILAGFLAVAIAKIYGLFFMRWKTPFRLGENMNVRHAEVVDWSNGKGTVIAGGELWKATSTDELRKGDPVIVAAVDGLLL